MTVGRSEWYCAVAVTFAAVLVTATAGVVSCGPRPAHAAPLPATVAVKAGKAAKPCKDPIIKVIRAAGWKGNQQRVAYAVAWRESKAAGLDTIPAIVRDDLGTRAAQIEAMLVENLHRSDLTVMEEAFAYEQLELLGVKVAAIAQATGRARATIESRKALTRLPEPARARVDDGDLTLDDAAFIAKHMDDEGLAAIIEKNIATSGHMIRWHVEQELRLREIRARQAQADAETETDSDDDDSEWDADDLDADGDSETWEDRRDERDAREAARKAALKMRRDWVAEQIANDSSAFWDGVIRYTVYTTLNDDESDYACEALGLQKWEETEDEGAWDKWVYVTVSEIMDRGLALRFLALTHYDTDDLIGARWMSPKSASNAHDYLGYPLTPYERELIGATAVTR